MTPGGHRVAVANKPRRIIMPMKRTSIVDEQFGRTSSSDKT